MDLTGKLAKDFFTIPDVISRIRSMYFVYKSQIAVEQVLGIKVAKDVKHKSPKYLSREKTFVFLRGCSSHDFEVITMPPRLDNRFGGLYTCLLDMIKDGYMEKNQPPTIEEFLKFHKSWRLVRSVIPGKNSKHELARIEQYELLQDLVEKRLKEEFNKITS
jgi:hypothetical protein